MDNVILAIKSLLSTALTTTYKKYFYGENKAPQQSHFPFIEIIPITTESNVSGTGGLRYDIYEIEINVKDTLKNHYKTASDNEILSHMQSLVKKMEDRDSDGTPKAATVLGVLNDNLTLSNSVHINDNWVITYDTSPYGESYIVIASLRVRAKLLTPN